ncbi:MAG: glycosyltransferase family 9 protein [Ignavibacteria bacterium]|nr:glycosyltransferase family 9 protein [Ignavibacteria bacterium]
MNLTIFAAMQTANLKHILIIQTASIGDVILVTPIIEKLHHFYPEAKIDLLIKKGYEDLFAGHPFLNFIWLWDKKTDKYKNLYHLIKAIRQTKFDSVINVQRFASTGFVTVFSGAKEKIGFNKNPLSLLYSKRIKHSIGKKNQTLHEIDRNLRLVQHLTDNTRQMPVLHPQAADFARVSPYKTKAYICIAPASLWFTKQFPESQWIEFMRQLPSDLHVYLLGSTADIPLCQSVIDTSAHANSINLAGKLSLLESAALMRDAMMNYVNDSAPMHLGSSINAKMTVIYCSTVPEFGFGPLSEDATIIETPEKLDCRPCGLHGYKECPKKHFKCSTTIKTQQLLDRL